MTIIKRINGEESKELFTDKKEDCYGRGTFGILDPKINPAEYKSSKNIRFQDKEKLHDYVVKAKEAIMDGKTVANFDGMAVVFDDNADKKTDSSHTHTSSSFIRTDSNAVSEVKKDLESILNKENKFQLKNRIEKQAEIIRSLSNERNKIKTDLINENVTFPTAKFNELVLEPPKPVEENIIVDLDILTKKLNQIENNKAEENESSDKQKIDLLYSKLIEYSADLQHCGLMDQLKPEQKSTQSKFLNESNLEFTDISSEQYRIYEFNNGKTVMIVEPLKLNVSKNGGHKIYDKSGMSHYIPQGWLHLSWRAKPNQPNFR